MAKRRRPMTLAEHDAVLRREGRYDEMIDARGKREREIARKVSEWRSAEAPLVKDLRAAGIEVDSAWDLVNSALPYPAALPILVAHLGQPYPDRVREAIARALAVKDARFAWQRLVRFYRDEPAGSDTKAGLAAALAEVADDDDLNELVALSRDSAHGESRILLLRALKRSAAPLARAALEELSRDPVLGKEARALLARRERDRPRAGQH